ncbi:MAG TPA: tetratricopeptide repeat protein [Sedimentisphaerales bacterium]|nr:tetratricopeptide repeat protein [Sedimentisphaerales bacterium]
MAKRQKNVRASAGVWLGLVVFASAILVRGVYLYESSDNPTFRAPVVDSLTYDQMARRLLAGEGLTPDFFWQPLFYPLFLAGVYRLSDFSILAVKVIQMILGGVTCLLVFRLGRRLFDRQTGILAGLIAASYMPLVFFEQELLATGWAAFCSVAGLLCLLRAREKPTLLRCLILGLVGAFSIIVRPVFLPVFAAGCLWLAIAWIRDRLGGSAFARGAVMVALGSLIILGPVAILSRQVTGRAKILPYSGGVNLYIGNNPNYEETINIRPGLGWRKLMELPQKQGVTDNFEKEKFFAKKAAQYARQQPISFLMGLAGKTMQFLSSREMPRNFDIYLFRRWSALLWMGLWKVRGFGFPFGVLLPLAVVGALSNWRKIPGPVWLFAILYPASVILVFVASRYRVPIVPVMSVLAAAGCAAILRTLKEHRWGLLAGVVVILSATVLASSIAGPFYVERLDFEPELYYGLGDSLDKSGQIEQAMDAYSKAVSLRGTYVEAHHNLGLLLVKQGRRPEAMEHYRAALQADPENAGLHEDMGVALFEQGMTDEAIRQYHKAVEIDPNKATVYDHLGTVYVGLNQLPTALQYYSRAVELDPKDPVSRNNLANVLAMTGQAQQAIEHYEKALQMRPGDAETLNNLANALASLGRFEQAIERYKEALQSAPDDAGIYCNLGTCLGRQGREAEAIAAFRQALAIDPQNRRALRALRKSP